MKYGKSKNSWEKKNPQDNQTKTKMKVYPRRTKYGQPEPFIVLEVKM